MHPDAYRHLRSTADLQAGLIDRRSNDLSMHRQAVERACHWYREVKEGQADATADMQAGGEWQNYVDERSVAFDVLAAGPSDAASELLANFCRNELGSITAQYAYFTELDHSRTEKVDRFVDRMCRDVAVWEATCDGSRAELAFPLVGNPWGIEIDGVLVSPQSLRFHHHSRRISSLLDDVDRPTILELGGGFGGMVSMTASAITRPFTYIDIDLPETAVIAAYYTQIALPDLRIHLATPSNPLTDVDLTATDVVIAPNYMMPQVPSGAIDLFLNAFSLSEMPEPTIVSYLAEVHRIGVSYILHNNVDRAGVVNRGSERTPGSRFPIDPDTYKRVYRTFDLFQGHDGDYREFLYERRVIRDESAGNR